MNAAPFTAGHQQTLVRVLQLVICATGAWLLWYATSVGVGVSPDSAEYIAAARRLHSLSDLFNLPAQWAPAYPVLLKLSFLSGLDILLATRVLQCLLLAGNLAAAVALLRHVCGKQSLLPLLGGIVLLCSFNLWEVNFYAWSEGPFLLCQQLSLLCLLRFLDAPALLRPLMFAALWAALALLCRYAGVAWIGTVGLVLLVLPSAPWQQRLRNAFGFGLAALLPFLLWIIANHFVRNETTNREFVVHLVSGRDLLLLLDQVLSWFGFKAVSLSAVIELALSLAVLWLALKIVSPLSLQLRWLMMISLCHAVVYTVFIMFSKSFLDTYIPFDERIFVSAWLFTVLVLLACAIQLLRSGGRTRLVAALALAVMTMTSASQVVPTVALAHRQGIGYLSIGMRQISRVDEVPQLPGKMAYSNAPDYLRMQTDLDVHDYPRRFIPTTGLVNPDYSNELALMQQRVQAGEALLVHYAPLESRSYFPDLAELHMLGYQSVMEGNGVQILSFAMERPASEAAQ